MERLSFYLRSMNHLDDSYVDKHRRRPNIAGLVVVMSAIFKLNREICWEALEREVIFIISIRNLFYCLCEYVLSLGPLSRGHDSYAKIFMALVLCFIRILLCNEIFGFRRPITCKKI